MKHTQRVILCVLFSLWFCLFAGVSCEQDPSPGDKQSPDAGEEILPGTDAPEPPLPATPPYDSSPKDESVIKVNFTGPTATVNLHDLDNHSVYLMKVNKGKEVADAVDTGSVVTYTDMPEFMDEDRAITKEPFHKTEAQDFVCGVGSRSESRGTNFLSEKADYTLLTSGIYGQIWVSDDVDGITVEQAQEMAAIFDRVYPIVSKPFGFDKTNSSSIPIRVHNTDGAMGGNYSAGRVYINTSAKFYDKILCTQLLIHEFLHFIQFKMNAKAMYKPHVEGQAVLAVDVFGPLVGVPVTNRNHPSQGKMTGALASYPKQGVNEWLKNLYGETFPYGPAYAFYAYLARNYGGIELFKNLVLNPSSLLYNSEDMITAALQETLPGTDLDFDKVLAKYAEAFVFSGTSIPDGTASFDKTVSTTIDGTDYVFTGFDVWDAVVPRHFSVNTAMEMRPQSVMMHYSSSAWGGRTGDFSVTLQKPNSDDVELYLMMRKKTGVL